MVILDEGGLGLLVQYVEMFSQQSAGSKWLILQKKAPYEALGMWAP